jgi:hypothetical protein
MGSEQDREKEWPVWLQYALFVGLWLAVLLLDCWAGNRGWF